MATGFVQKALEQAPNAEGGANAVSSNLFYLPCTNFEMDPKPSMLERNDELRGGFYRSPHSGAAKYEPEGSMDCRIYPATFGSVLHDVFGTCVTTAGDGSAVTDPDSVAVPVGAHRHVFTFKTGEVPQTSRYIYSPPSGGFYQASGVGIDEITCKPDGEGAWAFTAKLLGLVAEAISDPSLTPGYETAKPWVEGELALTWLANSAVTKEFDWKVTNGLAVERQFTTSSRYPDSIVYDANLPIFGGSIPKRAFDADDWAALVAGTTFAAKLKFVHSENATGSYKHQLWIEMPACQLVSGKQDPIKNQRRNEASYDWEARWDTATSKWVTVTLVNATAAYASYGG